MENLENIIENMLDDEFDRLFDEEEEKLRVFIEQEKDYEENN